MRRVVLLAGTPSFIARDGWPHGVPPVELKQFGIALAADESALMQRFLANMASGEADESAAERSLLSHFAERATPPGEVLRSGLQALRTFDLRTVLTEIRQPVLLIHGEADAVTPAEASRWMAAELPDASLFIISRCGHAPHLTHLDEVDHAVYKFLHA